MEPVANFVNLNHILFMQVASFVIQIWDTKGLLTEIYTILHRFPHDLNLSPIFPKFSPWLLAQIVFPF